jgi:hypothetical protein
MSGSSTLIGMKLLLSAPVPIASILQQQILEQELLDSVN